jgi:MFS family permease
LGFLTSVYFLSFALAQIPIGIAIDRFGARRTTVGSTAIVGTLAGAFLLQ